MTGTDPSGPSMRVALRGRPSPRAARRLLVLLVSATVLIAACGGGGGGGAALVSVGQRLASKLGGSADEMAAAVGRMRPAGTSADDYLATVNRVMPDVGAVVAAADSPEPAMLTRRLGGLLCQTIRASIQVGGVLPENTVQSIVEESFGAEAFGEISREAVLDLVRDVNKPDVFDVAEGARAAACEGGG